EGAAVALSRPGGNRGNGSLARCDRGARSGPLVLPRRGALRAGPRAGARGSAALRLRPLPHPRALSRTAGRAGGAPRRMHCELVVPGLFAARSATRLPCAELLIARGRCTASEARSLEAWLHDAFELGEEPLACGALTLLGGGGEPEGYSWSRADPVHLQLMRDRVLLVPAAALQITQHEAAALTDALNRHFGARLTVQAVDAERWVAKLPHELAIDTEAPLALAGRDVPLGLPAPELINEAQMLLHSHPLNEAREARGALPVN